MRNILVYDTDADEIEALAENNDMTTAEIIELLIDYIEDMKRSNKLN